MISCLFERYADRLTRSMYFIKQFWGSVLKSLSQKVWYILTFRKNPGEQNTQKQSFDRNVIIFRMPVEVLSLIISYNIKNIPGSP